jgi:hypothetical protein
MSSSPAVESGQRLSVPRPAGEAWSARDQASPCSPTVLGLKLLPGERVIYFHKLENPGAQSNLELLGGPLVVLGMLGVMAGAGGQPDGALLGGGSLVALVGLGLLVLLFTGKGSTQAHVVTTRRVIAISGPGAQRGVSLEDAWDIEAERAGGAVGLVSTAVEPMRDSDAPTMTPAYWIGASRILMMDGAFALATPEPMVLGPFLARCLQSPGFAERCAGVPYEP